MSLDAYASFSPGETLNPTCAPTDAGCIITPITSAENGGTGLSSYSLGDILYADSSSTLTALGTAPDGRVLKLLGGVPSWGNDAGGTDFLASELGLHLDTLNNTFGLVLNGSTLETSALGLKLSPTYPGQSSISTVGTITSGTWQGDPIAPSEGGTGLSSFTLGDLFYGSASSTVGKLPIGAEGSVLAVSAGLPIWEAHTPEAPYLASELGLHLATSTNTFELVLDGTSLTQTASGTRLSPAYIGQTTINTVGTISTGHWSGDVISALRGGTGNSNYTAGDMLYATTSAGIAKLPIGSNGTILKVVNGLPSWGVENVGSSYLASEQGLHLSTTTNTFLITLDGSSLAQSGSGLRLSSAYPGQSSINTLGTVTSGHWSGDPIDVSAGGTGVTATPNEGEVLMGNGSGYTLGNITGSEGVTITNGTGTVNVSLSVATIPTVTSPVSNDYLPIYASGTLLRKKISYADLFAGVLGSLNYQGAWDADTNTPTLSDANCDTVDKGRYYVVNSAGTTTLGGINSWASGDWLICSGTVWEKESNTNTVASVFGRMGTVTAQGGDYNALQITNIPAGSLTAITVQDALNELANEKEPAIATGTTAQFYRGDKAWQTLDTAAVTENPAALYYTDARARAAVNGNADGLAYDSVSGVLSLAAGRNIPYTASTTNWETAYDWGNHASAGYLTGLSGDGTTVGSGIAGLTLKTVNSNVGTFGSPTSAVTFTVNDKGLITAASSSAMIIGESDVIGLVSDLGNKLSSALTSGNIFVGNSSNVATGRTLTLSPSSGSFNLSSTGVLTLPNADSATRGLLTNTDWTTFTAKQAALGFTPENVANKSTDITTDGASDTKYPTAKAVKTYADNLALGFNWKQPVELINPVGEMSTPVLLPNNYDAYIISPGGNWTSVNPLFAPGDLLQYQAPTWVKIKSLVTGDRIGIGFKSTTTPSGPFMGKKNNIATFDSTLNGGNYTYTFSPPTNNDAVFVQNTNAYYHDVSFVYSTSLGEWVQLSATTNYTFGNGLNLSSGLVTLGALTSDWNQSGNFAMTTAGDINLNSGNLNTASTSANVFNGNATTLNIGGAANLINLGAAGATLRGLGTLNITTASSSNLNIDPGTTGALNLGTGNDAKTINIGTGNAGNIVNIGTSPTGTDTIAIGSTNDLFSLTSSGLNVSENGDLTGVQTIDGMNFSSTTISFGGSGSILSSNINALTLDSGTTGALNIGTGNFSKNISIGTGNAGNSILIGTNNTTPDTIDIGSANDAFALSSTGLNITTGGALSGVTAINGATVSSSTIIFAASGTIQTTGANALTLDSGTTGAINIATGDNAKTVNIATNDMGNIVNIGTNNIVADTISIGSSLDAFSLTSSGLNVSLLGALSGVASLNTITMATDTIAFLAAGSVNSGSGSTLTLDSGTNGDIHIGTGSFAKNITIGNSIGASALILDAGTGNISIGTSSPARLITIGGTGANTIALGSAQAGGAITIGESMTTGSIAIGGSGAQTGAITIGGGTGAQTLNLGTGDTGNKTINIGTGNAATNTINIGTNTAGVDVLNLGTAADQFSLTSSGLNVSLLGALSGVASLNTIGVSPTAITFASEGSILSDAIHSLTIDTGTTGTLNLGAGNHAKTINIATGNAGDMINIATDNTATDTVSIGSIKDNFTLSSSALNISSGGVLTGVASLNGLTLSSSALTFAATGTITSTGASALSLDSGTTGSVNLGIGNNAKSINIGTGTGGNTISIGTDNTTQDIIAIGSALDAFSITSNGFNVTTGGAISGFTTLNTITLAPTAITFAATGTVKSSGANALTIDSGTTGMVNLGSGNNAKTINLGTGNAGNTINIGTDNTVADAISIGSALDTLALSSTGLNVSTTGSLTGVSSINTIGVTSGTITFPAAGTIDSFDGFPLTLDSGTTGAVNLGAGGFSKTITIGNGTGTTSLALLAGTGNIDIGANAIARTINIGTGVGVPEVINIGGNGANTIGLGNTQAAGTLNIGNAMTTGAITIGGTGAQTGTITIGGGTGAQTLNFGTGGTGSKTINIGTGAVANTMTIGNTTGTSILHLSAGTGGIILGGVKAQMNGNLVLCINSTTHLLYYGSSNTACQSSSARYKYDIADLGLGLDAVMALRPVSYKYISDNSPALGFLAEDAANVDERLILRDDEGRPNAINPDYFTPILTKGIQQLNSKFDALITNSGIDLEALDALALKGALHVEGPLELGNDSAGEAVIRAGADHVTIDFEKPYTFMPVVTISKMSRGKLSDYFIDAVTHNGFTIRIDPIGINDMRFSWHAFASSNGKRTFSDGITEDINATTTSILDISHYIEEVSSIPANTQSVDTATTTTATETTTGATTTATTTLETGSPTTTPETPIETPANSSTPEVIESSTSISDMPIESPAQPTETSTPSSPSSTDTNAQAAPNTDMVAQVSTSSTTVPSEFP